MRKILDNIILFVFIYVILFIVMFEILGHFSLYFRQWVYYLSAIIIFLGFVIGIYYKINKNKSKKKKIALNIFFTIILIILLFNPYTLLMVLFSYQPEHIVEKDNKKMVAYVYGFLDTSVHYYEYINPFVIGDKIMEEYYGKGGFDPIKDKFGYEYEVISTTYYDKEGNIIKTESNSKKENNIENTNTNYTSVQIPKKEKNYYEEDEKYFTNLTGEKKEIISPTEAANIADKEAQNSKYQYQPWKSEFYSRGKNREDYLSIELILGLDEISRLCHWSKEWKKCDYENRLMWKVRLFDENDPLTSLYIYLDSVTGEIIGAGQSSD